MDANQALAERFEEHRIQLRAVAYRMLGSLSEAVDTPFLWTRGVAAAGLVWVTSWSRTGAARLMLAMKVDVSRGTGESGGSRRLGRS